jgi:hypothetical protein
LGETPGPGAFARDRLLLESLDPLSAQYLITKAAAEHKTTTEIIGDLVREKIAAASV